jgi:hypothetical protein
MPPLLSVPVGGSTCVYIRLFRMSRLKHCKLFGQRYGTTHTLIVAPELQLIRVGKG